MRTSPIIFAAMLYKWMHLTDILTFRSSPKLYWEQESQLQLIIHLQTKALFIVTQSRTHLDFTILQIIILSQTLSISVCFPKQMWVASTYPGHTNYQLQKPTVQEFLSFIVFSLFTVQSLLAIVKLYRMGDGWSKSYIGENISNLRDTLRLLPFSSPCA